MKKEKLAVDAAMTAVLLLLMVISFANSLIGVRWLRFLLSGLSVFARFQNFTNGIFDVAAVVYYLSLTALFLFLCVRVYDRRRYA